MFPPTIGEFENGFGEFFGDDVEAGRPVRVRFHWTAGERPRWEQAMSADGGRSWELNWGDAVRSGEIEIAERATDRNRKTRQARQAAPAGRPVWRAALASASARKRLPDRLEQSAWPDGEAV